jgi:(1->4)-alpha-D-glucan 1-alpha-D-glucosylmutase
MGRHDLQTSNLHTPDVRTLVTNWRDGRIKMHVTQSGLRFRRENASLFLKGTYVPLQIEGPDRECVIAFARRFRGNWGIVVVPRFTTRLVADDSGQGDPLSWGSTCILLPKDAPKHWVNVFTGHRLDSELGEISVATILHSFPVALLSSET